jgi:hypothetical protein
LGTFVDGLLTPSIAASLQPKENSNFDYRFAYRSFLYLFQILLSLFLFIKMD